MTTAIIAAQNKVTIARQEAARARLTYDAMKDNGYYPSYMLRDALADVKELDAAAHALELDAAAMETEFRELRFDEQEALSREISARFDDVPFGC